MKRLSALCLAFVALSMQTQTLKSFKVNITADGQANGMQLCEGWAEFFSAMIKSIKASAPKCASRWLIQSFLH